MKKTVLFVLCMLCLTAAALIGCNGGTNHEHYFGQEVATELYLATPATCIKRATYYYSCKCGKKDTDTFEYGELADHTEITDPAVAPTETENGLTEGKHCSVCGTILVAQQTIPSTAPANLNYTLSNDGTYYIVEGIGSETRTAFAIPSSHNGKPVKEIGDNAFAYCYSLTSITIPDSVTEIGSYAFNCCSSLTSITIPDSVTEIGSYAFAHCSSLTSITIPDSVTEIGQGAFYNCSSLTSVTIPDSVTEIGDYAFSVCYKLVEVINESNLNITKGSSDYGDVACYALNVKTSGTSDIVNKDGYLFYTYDNTNYLLAYVGNETELVLPDNYNGESYVIYYMAFQDCSSLTSVTIGNRVTSIGDWAFDWCSGLTSVTIGKSVTEIGQGAFRGCSSLTSVTIPDSVTEIGDYAFSVCYKLVEVINESNLNITKGSSDYGDVAYYALNVKTSGTSDIVNKDGYLFYTYDNTNYLFGYVGNETELVLPDNYNGESYVIYYMAFRGCSSLTSITIPDSVTSIGGSAFEWCSSLTSIAIPDSVTSIGGSAFNGCSSLTSITIPSSVTEIGYAAFYGCSNLTSITISGSVTSIGHAAFYGCSNLTSITISGSVTSIGNWAFGYCSSLTSIAIPGSVTSIGNWAFLSCSNLTSVAIGNGVTSIGYNAFFDCSSLTSITIPDSVTYIGDSAFEGCSDLTSIVIPDSVTSIGYAAFANCSSLETVYYKGTAEDWNNSTIDDGNEDLTNATIYYYTETKPTKDGNYWHYDADGVTPIIW